MLEPLLSVPLVREDGRGRPWRDPRDVLNGVPLGCSGQVHPGRTRLNAVRLIRLSTAAFRLGLRLASWKQCFRPWPVTFSSAAAHVPLALYRFHITEQRHRNTCSCAFLAYETWACPGVVSASHRDTQRIQTADGFRPSSVCRRNAVDTRRLCLQDARGWGAVGRVYGCYTLCGIIKLFDID